MDNTIIEQLRDIVGPGHLATDKEERLCYSYDGSGLQFPPAAVAFPGSATEISRIMALATKARFPVIPRGAGTGMTGGALPVAGGLVLAMSRLNRILEIDPLNQVGVVEPGVITGEFQAAVRQQGLYYPPDPASLKFCTLGGNVAECAGGPSAVKYGVTRDYVLGLEAVLPDGRLLATGVRTAKGVVGYDLTRLLVGSEGTLAVITKIIVRLLALPTAQKTFLVLGRSLAGITGLVTDILASGIRPSTLEYMDRTTLGIVAAFMPQPLPAATRALLLIEVDGSEPEVAAHGAKLTALLGDRARYPHLLEIRLAGNAEEIDTLWAARRAISPASFALKPHKLSEDVVVPRSRIPELVAFVEGLAEAAGLPILTFGHAGDGNIHVNIMLDQSDPVECARGEEAKTRLFKEVLRLSGTLSGEHGVGLTKMEFLPLEIDAIGLEVMRRIKQLFDPHNILNPGKVFPNETA